MPAEPQQAAKDAASAAKDSLPEPPKDLQNPIQNLFSGTSSALCKTNLDKTQNGMVATETPLAGAASQHCQCCCCCMRSAPDLSFGLCQLVHAGDNKPKEAAQDAASTVKSVLPDEPKQAAKDAASAVKDNLPEAPSNPFQSFFSGKHTSSTALTHWLT